MSKWVDFVIVAVRYDANNEYITHVKRYEDNGSKLVNLEVKSRSAIVNALNKGLIYVTATKNAEGKYTKGSEVAIYSDNYIRSSPNSTKRDNIESLLRF